MIQNCRGGCVSLVSDFYGELEVDSFLDLSGALNLDDLEGPSANVDLPELLCFRSDSYRCFLLLS